MIGETKICPLLGKSDHVVIEFMTANEYIKNKKHVPNFDSYKININEFNIKMNIVNWDTIFSH